MYSSHIAIIGLGYVGLPLAVEFSKKFTTTGFDLSANRIDELNDKRDSTQEVTTEELEQFSKIKFTSDQEDLKQCNIYIIAVTTPIDDNKRPDFAPLIGASRTVAKHLSRGDIVI